MAVTIGEFLERLETTGILDAHSLGEVRGEVDVHGGMEADAENFVKSLYAAGRLTSFQAKALWKDRGSQLVLGNYIVEEELGRGGMGVVLKARHRVMQRRVAIKVLPPNMSQDESAIARFDREVHAAAQLMHHNIVAAHDADEFDGRHALIMEFVDGRDLSSVVKRKGPFSVEQAIDCIVQTARGLEYAHAKGVVHRDIKPANLLLDSKGTVKILDMGLARFSEAADVGSMAELTGTGTIMGTVDYMSPEQAMSTRNADERSDVYSLGITLWYLLTARPAFEGESLMARMMAHADNPIPKLRDRRPDAPESLEAVFEQMVAKDPAERMQTMAEVAAALEACRGDESGTVVTARARGSEGSSTSVPLSDFLGSLDDESASGEVSRTLTRRTRRKRTGEPDSQTAISDAAAGTIRSRQEPSTTQRHVPATRGVRWTDWRLLSGVGGVLAVALLAVATSSGPDEPDDPGSSPPTALAGDDPNVANGTDPGGSGSGTASAPAPVGHALLFDGAGYVDVPSLRHDYEKPLTLEAWVRYDVPVRPPARQYVIGDAQGGGVGLRIDGGREWFAAATVTDSSWQPRTPVDTDGEWQHVAFVFEANEVRLFVDGRLTDRRGAPDLRIIPSQENFVIGAQPGSRGSFADFWTGAIDEVRVSNVARYADDFEPARRFEPDAETLALYHCDDASGAVLKDASGNAHHGRIVRARWVPAGQLASPDRPSSPSPSTEPALAFDGVNDHVFLPTLKYDATHSLTLEAWVTPRALKGTHALPNGGESPQSYIGNAENAGVGMGVREGGLWQVVLHDPGNADPLGTYAFVNSDETLVLGRRTHVAGVVDLESRELRLYVDGVRQSKTSKLVGPHKASNLPFVLGADTWGRGPKWQFPFDGMLHGVRISKGVRYTEDFTPERRWTPDADTLAQYDFDEGTGNTLHDASGHGHDGTIGGATWEQVGVPGTAALEFDGVDDYVNLPTLKHDGSHSLTLEGWVTAHTHQGVESYGRSGPLQIWIGNTQAAGVSLMMSAKGQWGLMWHAPQTTRPPDLGPYAHADSDLPAELGVRTHVAGVVDLENRELRLYVNGRRQRDIVRLVGPHESTDHSFHLGADVFPPPRMFHHPFAGRLYGVRISKGVRYTGDFTPSRRWTPDAATLALYDFDEGTGSTLHDSSGNGHDGTIVGAKWIRVAPPAPATEAALDFDGVDDHVWIPTLRYEVSQSATFEAWVTPHSLKGSQPYRGEFPQNVIGNTERAGAALVMRDGGRWMMLLHDPNGGNLFGLYAHADSDEPAKLDERTHVAGVVDLESRELRLYVDGVRQKQAVRLVGPHRSSVLPFVLGADVQPRTRFQFPFEGRLHGVRISSGARYKNDFLPEVNWTPDTDTLALYRFDEGTGNTLKDASGNGHDGEIVGATWVRATEPTVDVAASAEVDLLSLIEPQRDSVRGIWTHDGTSLVATKGQFTRAVVPHTLPPEYDLVLRATPEEGYRELGIGFTTAGARCLFKVDCFKTRGGYTGLSLVDGKEPTENDAAKRGRHLELGEEVTIELRVRRGHITADVDGERVLDWNGSGNQLSLPASYAVPDEATCFLYAHETKVRFDEFTLRVPSPNAADDATVDVRSRLGELVPLLDSDADANAWTPYKGTGQPVEFGNGVLRLKSAGRQQFGVERPVAARRLAFVAEYRKFAFASGTSMRIDGDTYGLYHFGAGSHELWSNNDAGNRRVATIKRADAVDPDGWFRVALVLLDGEVTAFVDGEKVGTASLPDPASAVTHVTLMNLDGESRWRNAAVLELTDEQATEIRAGRLPTPIAAANGEEEEYDGLATGEWIDVLAVAPPQPTSTATLADGVLNYQRSVTFPQFEHRNAIVRARVRHAGARNVSLRLRTNGPVQYHAWAHVPTDGLVGVGVTPTPAKGYQLVKSTRLDEDDFALDEDGNFEIAFAVVDNQLVFFVGGQRVLTANDTTITGNGVLELGTANGRAFVKDVQFMSLDTAEE